MLSCAVLYGILMVVYEYQVEPIIATGEHILFYTISPIYDVLFFVLGMVPTFWLPTHCYKPSHFSWWILYITIVAPTCIEAPHMLNDTLRVWPMVVAVVLFFCLLMQVSNFKPLTLPRISTPPVVFWSIAVVFTLVTFISLIAFYGLPKEGLSLSTAHAFRAAFKEKSKDVPLIIRYLFRWDGEVVLPCFVAYGAVRRKFLPIMVGCAGEAGLFMITTFREYALTPLFLLCVGGWLLMFKKNNGTALIVTFTGLSGVFAGLTVLKESLALITMTFFDRFILIGGQVTAMYYDFFLTHSPGYYGTSFGQLFVTAPYATDIGVVVGNLYYEGGSSTTGTNAPAYFWADAFGNALWPGIIVAQILAMGIYWVIDSAYVKFDKRAAVVMGVMISLSISTEGLQTTALTGGLIPMVIVGLMGARTFRPVPERERRRARTEPAAPLRAESSPSG